MRIRLERRSDIEEIRSLITFAFQDAPHSSGSEAAIVDALRAHGALSLSLVSESSEGLVGHVAFSQVLIDGRDEGWFGLGPLAVRTSRRRSGLGAALVHEGIRRLDDVGAKGCVVLGAPAYYARFGFVCDPDLRLAGVPAEYFQSLAIKGNAPRGTVTYHAAFDAG